jgi:hypothetical protein
MNVAPANVETVNYLERVVHVVPDRYRRTFVNDSVTNFCNLEFFVSLQRLKYLAAYSFGMGDLFVLEPTM